MPPQLEFISSARVIALMAIILASASACRKPQTYLSPECIVAAPDGKHVYITERTSDQIASIETTSNTVQRTLSLKFPPTGVAVSRDGAHLCVTAGEDEGCLYWIDTARMKLKKTIRVGHSPCAPVLSPDAKTAYVCNRFINSVAVVDLTHETVTTHIPVMREPIAAALTPDGKSLFVVNLLPLGRADNDYVAAVVSVIDTAARKVATSITLPNGSSSLRGITLSPDGRYAYITHTLSRYQLPTTQLERGWMNTSALTVIDTSTRTIVNTVLLDDVALGAANPWGLACSTNGSTLIVAHSGTREISLIDRVALHEKLARVAKGEKVTSVSQQAEDVQGDLSFLTGLRQRIRLPGIGPRGVAVAGNSTYVAEYFTDSLSSVKLTATENPVISKIALGPEIKPDQIRQGEMLFADATLCFQQWQSCTSCHPDNRVDGLNWDLLNDGIGNPKQTKSLLLSHRTPPAMISGIRESSEKAVRSGMKFILFATLPEDDALAIDEFLKSLRPVPSPHLVGGNLSPEARRGKKLFMSTGCAECHPAPLYTHLKSYDVGTGTGNEAGRKFDTPTLVEVWRTAPYLYDGRAATMTDVLTTCNTNDLHGKTSTLSPAEINDLAEYVLSL